MCKVSVIVPVYNAQTYINKCVRSILDQTYTDFELILVDDGSADQSGMICESLAELDDRITVLHQSNGGVSKARNSGLRMATGQYIMFCDSDDWVKNNWIDTMVSFAETNPESWIVSGIDYIQDGGVDIKLPFRSVDSVRREKISEFYCIHQNWLDGYCFNKIYRKDILDIHQIYFDAELVFGEDLKFNLEYLSFMKDILGIPYSLYCYNADNMESATHQFDESTFDKHKMVYNLRKKYIDKAYIKIFSYEFYNICMNDIRLFSLHEGHRFSKKIISYGNSVIRSKEFIECLSNGADVGMHPVYVYALTKRNYFWVFLIDKFRYIAGRGERK